MLSLGSELDLDQTARPQNHDMDASISARLGDRDVVVFLDDVPPPALHAAPNPVDIGKAAFWEHSATATDVLHASKLHRCVPGELVKDRRHPLQPLGDDHWSTLALDEAPEAHNHGGQRDLKLQSVLPGHLKRSADPVVDLLLVGTPVVANAASSRVDLATRASPGRIWSSSRSHAHDPSVRPTAQARSFKLTHYPSAVAAGFLPRHTP